jgi:type I restriction enzyme M protein
MIIAGDGHTNIQPENTLAAKSQIWNAEAPDCDSIMTNPPFGASESGSFEAGDWDQYVVRAPTTQMLFLQKMMACTVAEGDICTVIDDGLLNTATACDVRKMMFQKTKVRAVVRLPEETFKPNKINVRSSVLLLRRYESDDIDLERNHKVTFVDLETLGYEGSGDSLRGFNFDKFLQNVEAGALNQKAGSPRAGDCWRSFEVDAADIIQDGAFRLDLKYWEPDTRQKIAMLEQDGATSIKELNRIETGRGKSPKADTYVDEKDGYALVVKAGSNITKFGELLVEGDFIEKAVYDEMETVHLQKGDVLLASTGTGTLGKACVYDSDWPAIADGHVTIIRPDTSRVHPYYLADYLRMGGGAIQVERLYTGATGLIELQPDEVDRILVDLLVGTRAQAEASKKLRSAEAKFRQALEGAGTTLDQARAAFAKPTHLSIRRVA